MKMGAMWVVVAAGMTGLVVANATTARGEETPRANVEEATSEQMSLVLPTSGAWWNPSRQGNLFDISHGPDGKLVFVGWFTFDPSGAPVWYAAYLEPQGNVYTGPICSTRWNKGQVEGPVVRGTATLALTAEARGNISWTLDETTHGSEEIQHLQFGGGGAAPLVTGSWYRPEESGWGIFFDVQGNTVEVEVAVYNAEQEPIWVRSRAVWNGSSFKGDVYEMTGINLCPGCSGPQSTSEALIGSMTLENINLNANPPTASLTLIPDPPLSEWTRYSLPIFRLSQ